MNLKLVKQTRRLYKGESNYFKTKGWIEIWRYKFRCAILPSKIIRYLGLNGAEAGHVPVLHDQTTAAPAPTMVAVGEERTHVYNDLRLILLWCHCT